jgi:type I restriction enzyme, S subunit
MSPNHQTTTTEGGVNPALVPKLRFPDFRWAEGWEEKRLGNEGDLISSLTGKAGADFDTGDARFVTYMNVFSNTFTDPNALRFVDVKEGENQNAVASGDVFFTISSETPEEVGMASVLLEDLENCYLNSFCALFRFSESKRPNPVFTGYLLRQPLVRAYFTKKAQGSTRFNLSKDAFRSLPLCIPSLAEQKKIAECLSSLDELLAAQARKVDALKTHKKGLMQQLFPREGETQPRLRFPEFQNAGEWDVKRVDEQGSVLAGKALAVDAPGPQRPYLRTKNVLDGAIDLSDVLTMPMSDAEFTRFEILDGDVLLNEGQSLELVGRASIYHGEFGQRCAMQNALLRFRAFQSTSAEFAAQYFRQCQKDGAFANVATKTTSVAHLGSSRFSALKLAWPSAAEQKRIATCLSSLDALITAETQKHEALKTHKRGLMQQLFPSPEEATS